MVDLSVIPLKAISPETKHLLAILLNPPKIIPGSNGLQRDWRGFAHVCKISGDTFNAIAWNADSFNSIVDILLKNKEFTLLNLKCAIETIERYDIIQDAEPLIEKDAEIYLENLEKSKISPEIIDISFEAEILTPDDLFKHDRGERNQHYDAFLLYADEDEDFAMEMIDNLEKKNNFKLCLKDRDLIAGISFEHVAIMKLISERCNRLITIISPEFLKSHVNKFFLNFAQATGIDKNEERKIIPCIYKNCDLPPQILYFSKIYYNKPEFFWEKLTRSMRASQSSSNMRISAKILDKIGSLRDQNTSSKKEHRSPDLLNSLLNEATEHEKSYENIEKVAATREVKKSQKSSEAFFWTKKRKTDKKIEKEKTMSSNNDEISTSSTGIKLNFPLLNDGLNLDVEASSADTPRKEKKVKQKKKWNPIKKVQALLEK